MVGLGNGTPGPASPAVEPTFILGSDQQHPTAPKLAARFC